MTLTGKHAARESELQAEMSRKTMAALQQQQQRLRQSVDEAVTRVTADSRQLASQFKTGDQSTTTQLRDLTQKLQEHQAESTRQYEAIQHAIMAFADILHVSSPLVSM